MRRGAARHSRRRRLAFDNLRICPYLQCPRGMLCHADFAWLDFIAIRKFMASPQAIAAARETIVATFRFSASRDTCSRPRETIVASNRTWPAPRSTCRATAGIRGEARQYCPARRRTSRARGVPGRPHGARRQSRRRIFRHETHRKSAQSDAMRPRRLVQRTTRTIFRMAKAIFFLISRIYFTDILCRKYNNGANFCWNATEVYANASIARS